MTGSKKTWCDRGNGRGYGWRTKKVPKFICRDAGKVPDVSSCLLRASERAEYSSPIQNTSAGLGGRFSDGVSLRVLEVSMEEETRVTGLRLEKEKVNYKRYLT